MIYCLMTEDDILTAICSAINCGFISSLDMLIGSSFSDLRQFVSKEQYS